MKLLRRLLGLQAPATAPGLRKWIEAAGRAGVLRRGMGREYIDGDFSPSTLYEMRGGSGVIR